MIGNDTNTLVFQDSTPFPTDSAILAAQAACASSQSQISAWQLELSTTTAAVVALGSGYVAGNAITQVQYNAKLVRIVQLRSLLGIP